MGYGDRPWRGVARFGGLRGDAPNRRRFGRALLHGAGQFGTGSRFGKAATARCPFDGLLCQHDARGGR